MGVTGQAIGAAMHEGCLSHETSYMPLVALQEINEGLSLERECTINFVGLVILVKRDYHV